MDIARSRNTRAGRLRRSAYVAAALILVGGASVGVARLRPAAPTVEAAALWPDTVKRGPMVRQIRGPGTLVPEDLRSVAAPSAGRVERIVVRPGTAVEPDTIVLELSNPQLEQEAQEAALKMQASEAVLSSLRIQIQSDTLQQRAAMAAIEADYQKARMQADMNEALAARQLVSELVRRQSRLDADQLAIRRTLATEQLASRADAGAAQLAVQQSSVDQARALAALKARQLRDLRVRAGISGVLQTVAVDVGQQIAPGANLARVANPGRLKAEIRIAETQAKDVQLGQPASIDTHNGLVRGRVVRIDPSVQAGTRTVDVSLDDALPRGAVPDLSVDGTIELERLEQVLFMGRPAFGQEQSRVTLFKVEPDGAHAARVPVVLGRSSVNAIEVLEGLAEGDRVILSDMSAWDGVDRIRLE
ncbi:MAG TPA: efflux RND transporter periplasmic adaptor subunit [Vicinamibacterales bacterium]|nr:efflux RND transporter periplasmic adaptor subunit [Vicinamibacterales bacterium]